MSKQYFTRDEVKTLLREAIQRKTEPVVEDNKPEKTYTLEEVKALIIKDRRNRDAAPTAKEA